MPVLRTSADPYLPRRKPFGPLRSSIPTKAALLGNQIYSSPHVFLFLADDGKTKIPLCLLPTPSSCLVPLSHFDSEALE